MIAQAFASFTEAKNPISSYFASLHLTAASSSSCKRNYFLSFSNIMKTMASQSDSQKWRRIKNAPFPIRRVWHRNSITSAQRNYSGGMLTSLLTSRRKKLKSNSLINYFAILRLTHCVERSAWLVLVADIMDLYTFVGMRIEILMKLRVPRLITADSAQHHLLHLLINLQSARALC